MKNRKYLVGGTILFICLVVLSFSLNINMINNLLPFFDPVIADNTYQLRYTDGEEFRECDVELIITKTGTPDTVIISVLADSGEVIHIGTFYINGDEIWLIENSDIATLVCSARSGGALAVNNDECVYTFNNSLVETGYYERFVWKRGVGLVEYKRGYGAERDGVELILRR